MPRAVAIDLGATSGRYALGELADGQIRFEIIRQVAHEAEERNGRLEWQFWKLLELCKEAALYARDQGAITIGIDSWGVDHGFIDSNGEPWGEPVCYRDRSHLAAFESLAPHGHRLYELTGIQHQPFNTIYQLIARRTENPDMRGAEWMILPDLLGFHLTEGYKNHEMTQASTTQLLGLDGRWSEEAFDLAGWPVPERQPAWPGTYGMQVFIDERRLVDSYAYLAHVGSHDTASAVAGFGQLAPDQMFLNAGTWSLAGVVIDEPIATREAEAAMFTNERTVDGKIRFLKNIPGFYVVNRLHKELGINGSVSEWLDSAGDSKQIVDLFHPDFFNPESMVRVCLAQLQEPPTSDREWAAIALNSMATAVASTVAHVETLTNRKIREIRVGGGGSQSAAFCSRLANRTGRTVKAGPAEVTVLGNLAAQFLAGGYFNGWPQAFKAVENSGEIVEYRPG